ncbi:MAG: peptide deformylase [Candidatus Sumerlaeia bacterium]
MAIMDVLTYGDEFLRRTVKPVQGASPQVRRLAADMGETMYHLEGLGLAGPQVGLDMRLIVLDVDQVDEKNHTWRPNRRHLQVFLNPEILEESEEDGPYNEGCLSIPGVQAEVFRPLRVTVRYRDLEFRERTIEADGLLARVLQHEIDHLNGVLFIDRISRAARLKLAGKLNRIKKQTLEKLAAR